MKGGNEMKTKKAISDIVSTVLIIMIAVAAVGIIGAIVVPMVRNSLQGGTACLNALSDVSIETQGTCFNQNISVCEDGTNSCSNISVQVRKGSDASVILDKLIIQVMDSEGNSEPTEIGATDVGLLSLGGVRTFKIGGISNNAKSITLAPVVKMGNSAKQCDASTSPIVLVPCS